MIMVDKTILQLPEVTVLDANETIHVSNNVGDFRLGTRFISNNTTASPVTKADVGLGNVDNTADLDKPISTLTRQAIDNLVDITTSDYELSYKSDLGHMHDIPDITALNSTLDLKAVQRHLDERADVGHTHVIPDITNLQTAISSKAIVGHTHTGAGPHEHTYVETYNLLPDIGANTIRDYYITNYDIETDYVVSCTAGTIVQNLDAVTYTAPATLGPVTIYINEKIITLNVVAPKLDKPTIGTDTATINTSVWSSDITSLGEVIFGNPGANYEWTLSENSDLSNPITLVSLGFPASVISSFSSTTAFKAGTDYYVKVRHMATGYIDSDWSDTVLFHTFGISEANKVWNEKQKIIAGDKYPSDYFGYSVSISGDGVRCVVGARHADTSGLLDAGKAYIFLRSGTTWTQEAILSASDKAAYDTFGQSVSIDSTGTRCIIGVPFADPLGIGNAGKVHLFLRTGISWSEEAILTASDKTSIGEFGQTVSISGDGTRCIIGSPGFNSSGIFYTGKAYIFSRSGTTWTEEAMLALTTKKAYDYFGQSVSMSGDGTRCVVGAPSADPSSLSGAGQVSIYLRSGTTWTEEVILTASDKATGDAFGGSVSISGNGTRCIIGASVADPSGLTSAGKAYVFSSDGTTWTEEAILTASDKASGDYFGASLSIDNTGIKCIVGAAWTNTNGFIDSGKAYIFKRTGTTWTEELGLVNSDNSASVRFGNPVSISADGTKCLIGAPNASPSAVSAAGQFYYFSYE
jgi:hypothetical protein